MNKYIILLILPFLFFSCEKDELVSGCIDSDAVNYNEWAEIDDGSCMYEGEVLLWWTEDFGQDIYAIFGFFPSFEIFVDGQFAGSVSSSIYYNYAPDCGQGAVETTVNLGYLKQRDVQVNWYYQGDSFFSNTWTVLANTCNVFQLD